MPELDFEELFSFTASAKAPSAKLTMPKKKIKKPKTKATLKAKLLSKNDKKDLAKGVNKSLSKAIALATAKPAKAKMIITKAKAIVAKTKAITKPAPKKFFFKKPVAKHVAKKPDVNDNGQRARAIAGTLPSTIRNLKGEIKKVAKELKGTNLSPSQAKKLGKVIVQAEKVSKKAKSINKDIAALPMDAPIVPPRVAQPFDNEVIDKLNKLESAVIEQQDSAYRTRVLGKLKSIKSKIDSGSLASRGVYA